MSGDNSLEERLAKIEERTEWLEKSYNEIKDTINDLSHKVDKKMDKMEARLWFSLITVIMIILSLIITLK